MVTYLGALVQLCCGEGGTLQANLTGVCGERAQCLGHTGFAPGSRWRVLPRSTLLRLQGALEDLPGPGCWVSWVHSGSTVSGVSSVSPLGS